MKTLKRTTLIVAIVALVAVSIAMVAPKTASALAAVLMQNVDEPARAPFQTQILINANNLDPTPVAIPAGKRLVIDFVSVNGFTQASTSAGVQPLIVLHSSVAGGEPALYYFTPILSPADPGQYYLNTPATIYSDSLSVAPDYAGPAPSLLTFEVIISGHLINVS
jgi:hypothetical protein